MTTKVKNLTKLFILSDASAIQKEREERVRKIREQQEEERNKKIEELKNHVSLFTQPLKNLKPFQSFLLILANMAAIGGQLSQ